MIFCAALGSSQKPSAWLRLSMRSTVCFSPAGSKIPPQRFDALCEIGQEVAAFSRRERHGRGSVVGTSQRAIS